MNNKYPTLLSVQASCLNSTTLLGHARNIGEIGIAADHSASILIADKISTTDLMPILHKNVFVAVIVRHGSLADHVSVLLNGLGIQLAIAPSLPTISSGMPILIDGSNQKILISKHEDLLQPIHRASTQHQQNAINNQTSNQSNPRQFFYRDEPVSIHVDGKTNAELALGLQYGAAGIGILRTEWLDWDKAECPDITRHYEFYKECITNLFPHRLNIRLFDLGGDKIPKWAEDISDLIRSPLAYRGIRAFRYLPVAFQSQLSAITRIAANCQLGIVIPMVTNAEEIYEVRQLLSKIADEHILFNIKLGIMVEVPAAAIDIQSLLCDVDFIRIGPGDLAQFTLAKLRTNLNPSEFSGCTIHPSVLALVKKVTDECKVAEKPVSFCLDVEPRTSLLQILLSAGVRVFCVSPPNVKITLERLKAICGLSN